LRLGVPINLGMNPSEEAVGWPKRLMAQTAAAMYGGAAALGMIEGLIPGGQTFSPVPGLISLALVVFLLAAGPRLPIAALAALGPIGVVMISGAISSTDAPGDAAVLYMWPVLWVSYFFGRLGSVLIVAWVGACHAAALLVMQPEYAGSFDRWFDVMVSVAIVALVIQALSDRNRRLLSKLAAEARIDKLTAVLNRRGFDERVAVELARARREGSAVAAVAFDIDHFKRINDEWGHDAGDQVLTRLGDVLRAETRAADVVARIGGEEFVAVLSPSDVDHAHAYAERVRESFSRTSDLGLGLPRLTVSAGVVAADSPGGAQELLHVADSALYAAKRAGRDRTVVRSLPSKEAGDGSDVVVARAEHRPADPDRVGASS
jgi:diguanylate cyclase (GGDEF)-like protein